MKHERAPMAMMGKIVKAVNHLYRKDMNWGVAPGDKVRVVMLEAGFYSDKFGWLQDCRIESLDGANTMLVFTYHLSCEEVGWNPPPTNKV